jgi:hypothetical protein
MQAAQYSDEWVCHSDAKGVVISAFRSFYICQAHTDRCMTVTPSKLWKPKHEDPLASQQRWYCACCGAKYKTSFGMVVEIQVTGHDDVYYVRAEIPPENLDDLRGLYLEETLKPSSPEDLYQKLQKVVPQRNETMRAITRADLWPGKELVPGVCKISALVYDDLPEFKWQQIMNFADPKVQTQNVQVQR